MNATALYAPDPGPETNPAAFPAAYARLADLTLPAQVLWGDGDFPHIQQRCVHLVQAIPRALGTVIPGRSEEHTSELQSLMRISYAVFCLKKKNKNLKMDLIQQITYI